MLNPHSIVTITSLIVAASASAITSRFDHFSKIGQIVGTSVSAAFLLILGAMNIYILYRLVEEMRRIIDGGEEGLRIGGGGCLGRALGRLFWIIDR